MEPSEPTEYHLQELLGVGKCANVYKGIKHLDPSNTPVAIKIFKKELLSVYSHDNVREVFSREARLTQLCKHPNVIELHDYFIKEEQPWLIMGLVDGLPLKEKINRGGISIDDSILLIQQLLTGLGNIHANGVVHGDIKPANVLVTDANRVSICDFGLASDANDKDPYCQMSGTPGYISPEQLKGNTPDQRSDLYAAGLIFYELLLQSRNDSHDLPGIYQLRKGKIKILEMLDLLPSAFAGVILRATNPEPEMRYQTAPDFARAIFRAYKKFLFKSGTKLHKQETVKESKRQIQGPPKELRYCSLHQQELILKSFRSINGPIANLIFKKKLKQSNSLSELGESLSDYIEHQIERIHFQKLISELLSQ